MLPVWSTYCLLSLIDRVWRYSTESHLNWNIYFSKFWDKLYSKHDKKEIELSQSISKSITLF